MRSERHSQRDLFEERTTVPHLRPDLQAKLTPLLQILLTEAAGVGQPDETHARALRRTAMTKITPEHLARVPSSMFASRRPIRSSTITRAAAGSTPSSIAPARWGGTPLR